MKSVRIYGEHDIRVEDVPVRSPAPDQVRIKVKFCGICGSDLHAYLQGWGLPTQPYPLTGRMPPIILGHEFSGQITDVGSAVSGLNVGDRVAVEPLLACGSCSNCRAGRYNFCDRAKAPDGAGNFLGFSEDGGMAEYANVAAAFAHPLPAGVDYDLGALAEPTAVAYEGLKRCGLRAGQTAAVMGAGPIGLLTAMLARIAGANRVFLSDVSETRLAKARELGFTDVLNPAKVDVSAAVHRTCPEGVDVAFEAAGVQSTLNTALQVVRRAGTVLIVALFGRPVTLNLTDDVIMQGIDLLTTLCYNNSFPAVLGIIANHPDEFRSLITRKIGLDGALDQGIKALASDKSQVKIMISPEL